ncbi:MAG: hypothetical protein ACOC2L_02950 [Candidatus Sumerlaeota bacterium]
MTEGLLFDDLYPFGRLYLCLPLFSSHGDFAAGRGVLDFEVKVYVARFQSDFGAAGFEDFEADEVANEEIGGGSENSGTG